MPVSHAANSGTFKVTTPSDCEIVITRLFDAPPRLVFEAMTKPEHVRNGGGFSTTDIRSRHAKSTSVWAAPGASRPRPRGAVPAFYGVYREIVAPERLVYTEIFEPFPDIESVVTQLLTKEGGKTRLTVTSVYPSREVRDMVLETGMEGGAALSYDRLDDVARELRSNAGPEATERAQRVARGQSGTRRVGFTECLLAGRGPRLAPPLPGALPRRRTA